MKGASARASPGLRRTASPLRTAETRPTYSPQYPARAIVGPYTSGHAIALWAADVQLSHPRRTKKSTGAITQPQPRADRIGPLTATTITGTIATQAREATSKRGYARASATPETMTAAAQASV